MATLDLSAHARRRCEERHLDPDDVLRIAETPWARRESRNGSEVRIGRAMVAGRRWAWIAAVVHGTTIVSAWETTP